MTITDSERALLDAAIAYVNIVQTDLEKPGPICREAVVAWSNLRDAALANVRADTAAAEADECWEAIWAAATGDDPETGFIRARDKVFTLR